MTTREQNIARGRRGFTMMELLSVVAIIAVLFAVAIPAVSSIHSSLEMSRLDATAKQIYVAAQNRVSAMQSTGRLSNLTKAVSSQAVTKGPDYPGADYSVYYVTKGSAGFSDQTGLVLTQESSNIVGGVAGGSYIIELSPATGEVYSVFYSDSDSFSWNDVSGLEASGFDQARKDAKIGYYGGKQLSKAGSASDDPFKDDLSISLKNEEELYISLQSANGFKQLALDADTAKTFSVTVSIKGTNSSWYPTDARWEKIYSASDFTFGSNSDEADIILDSMRTINARSCTFGDITDPDKAALYPGTLVPDATTYRLLPGTDIEVTVTVSCNGAQHSVGSLDENSLFQKYDSVSGTVTAANVRHLNNLRKERFTEWMDGVNTFSHVVLGRTISSEEFAAGKTAAIDFNAMDWNATDVSVQSRETVTVDGVATVKAIQPIDYFVPIAFYNQSGFANSGSNTIVGKAADESQWVLKNFIIGDKASPVDNTGLFSTLGCTVSDVHMVDFKVYGLNNTGALSGAMVNASNAVSGCQLITTARNATTNLLDFGSSFVSGQNNTGGICGTSAVAISQSAVVANVIGSESVGGIVGSVSNGGDGIDQCSVGRVSDDDAYSGLCMIQGTANVGGLVGETAGGAISASSFIGNVVGGTSGTCIGGVVGLTSNWAVVSDCSVKSDFSVADGEGISNVSGSQSVGGFVGEQESATISNCLVRANVSGDSLAGGFVGFIRGGSISGCGAHGDAYADGASAASFSSTRTQVESTNGYSGGFVGVQADGEISKSATSMNVLPSADSTISSNTEVGGFAGGIYGGYTSTSYSSGSITAGSIVGGFVGYSENGTVENSYSTSTVAAMSTAGGFVGRIDGGSFRSNIAYGRVGNAGYGSAATLRCGGFIGYSKDNAGTGYAESWRGNTYLSMHGYNDSAAPACAQPAAAGYASLTTNANLSVGDTHSYDSQLFGKAFVFASSTPYYGDWPVGVAVTFTSGSKIIGSYEILAGDTPDARGIATPAPYLSGTKYDDYAYNKFSSWDVFAPVYSDTVYDAQWAKYPLAGQLETLGVTGSENGIAYTNFNGYLSTRSSGNIVGGKAITIDSETPFARAFSNATKGINLGLDANGYHTSSFSWRIYIASNTRYTPFSSKRVGEKTGSSTYQGNYYILVGDKIPAYGTLTAEQLKTNRYAVIKYDVGRASHGDSPFMSGTVTLSVTGVGDSSYYTYNQTSFSVVPGTTWYSL